MAPLREKQDDSLSNYAKRLDKSFGKIDWNKSALEIERLVRGLNSWPSAYTTLETSLLKIWEADVLDSDEETGCYMRKRADSKWNYR